jgi:hypothetical protein
VRGKADGFAEEAFHLYLAGPAPSILQSLNGRPYITDAKPTAAEWIFSGSRVPDRPSVARPSDPRSKCPALGRQKMCWSVVGRQKMCLSVVKIGRVPLLSWAVAAS